MNLWLVPMEFRTKGLFRGKTQMEPTMYGFITWTIYDQRLCWFGMSSIPEDPMDFLQAVLEQTKDDEYMRGVMLDFFKKKGSIKIGPGNLKEVSPNCFTGDSADYYTWEKIEEVVRKFFPEIE